MCLAQLAQELLAACSRGDLIRAKELVERGADVEASDGHGWTATMWSAYFGHVEVVGFLVGGWGASIHSISKDRGSTALMLAAGQGHVEVVRCLVERGAAIGATNKNGSTAQGIAANSKQGAVVRYLQQHARPQVSNLNQRL